MSCNFRRDERKIWNSHVHIRLFFVMQNEGGRPKIELTGIAATEKSLRVMTGIASWT